MNLERLEALIGEENLNRISKLNILIVGLGGVGGYAFESLVRLGIGKFTIIDFDVIDSSNLNRQVITNQSNIGLKKVEEAKKRALSINPLVIIEDLALFLNEENIEDINIKRFDYVVDACDFVNTKVLLMNKCLENNIKIVSSMGTAKKMDATKVSITTLDKTSYDPLAKKIRRLIDKKSQKKIVVVNSTEQARDIKILGSNSYVPATAGLFITNYIVNDVLNLN